MCGATPQSGDFHVFEMFDQHLALSAETGSASPESFCSSFISRLSLAGGIDSAGLSAMFCR